VEFHDVEPEPGRHKTQDDLVKQTDGAPAEDQRIVCPKPPIMMQGKEYDEHYPNNGLHKIELGTGLVFDWEGKSQQPK
jgi:hypothetical protein